MRQRRQLSGGAPIVATGGDDAAAWGRSHPITIKDIKIALMGRKRRIETSLKLFQAWAGRSSRVAWLEGEPR
jgi:hypothetical protein